ncbi:MAG TPA: hypothetical protein VK822_07595 [Acetobacteraceae bacterium]|jgi:hypothetical protein|nr:hypothetical protein [Acetobacteraceae bacterium]
MNMRYVVLFAGSALAACTAAPGPNAEAEGAVYGYRYHDANHTGDASTVRQASPQAIYNATHGVWLWPPAESVRPG